MEQVEAPHREHDAAPADARAPIDQLLDNPLTGFVPWVALYVIEGPGTVTAACAIALVMSTIVLVLEKARGVPLTFLSYADVLAFAGFLLGSLAAAPSTIDWFEDWFSTLGNAFLAVVVFGTIVARSPFTLPYAKDQTDPEYWDTPAFLRVNYVVTAVWAAAFLVGALAGFFGAFVLSYEDNIWTGWLIQIIAVMVAVAFTSWYGPHTMALTIRAAGHPDEPRAPVWDFWKNVATYLIPIGVVSLLFDGGPRSLGVGFVIVGLVLRFAFGRRAAAARASSARAGHQPLTGAPSSSPT